MGRFLATLEYRLLPGGKWVGGAAMLMKTGEDGTALRVTAEERLGFGDSLTRGRVRLRIAEGLGGDGIGGLSNVSVDGRGVLCASEGA